jgi:hypothetical protein
MPEKAATESLESFLGRQDASTLASLLVGLGPVSKRPFEPA